eukprot:TRINITY_DN2184_c0_g1_i1.p1 TRINITY_DN2184_c0_g1~~TRINITY_DN2184_c0_g1_i1.p1  ORF type:complete len:557 (-),score=89.52 TRINITY_DN2184_c0_g1_i1:614-2284(-)
MATSAQHPTAWPVDVETTHAQWAFAQMHPAPAPWPSHRCTPRAAMPSSDNIWIAEVHQSVAYGFGHAVPRSPLVMVAADYSSEQNGSTVFERRERGPLKADDQAKVLQNLRNDFGSAFARERITSNRVTSKYTTPYSSSTAFPNEDAAAKVILDSCEDELFKTVNSLKNGGDMPNQNLLTRLFYSELFVNPTHGCDKREGEIITAPFLQVPEKDPDSSSPGPTTFLQPVLLELNVDCKQSQIQPQLKPFLIPPKLHEHIQQMQTQARKEVVAPPVTIPPNIFDCFSSDADPSVLSELEAKSIEKYLQMPLNPEPEVDLDIEADLEGELDDAKANVNTDLKPESDPEHGSNPDVKDKDRSAESVDEQEKIGTDTVEDVKQEQHQQEETWNQPDQQDSEEQLESQRINIRFIENLLVDQEPAPAKVTTPTLLATLQAGFPIERLQTEPFQSSVQSESNPYTIAATIPRVDANAETAAPSSPSTQNVDQKYTTANSPTEKPHIQPKDKSLKGVSFASPAKATKTNGDIANRGRQKQKINEKRTQTVKKVRHISSMRVKS